jgi:hypothetical protein
MSKSIELKQSQFRAIAQAAGNDLISDGSNRL